MSTKRRMAYLTAASLLAFVLLVGGHVAIDFDQIGNLLDAIVAASWLVAFFVLVTR